MRNLSLGSLLLALYSLAVPALADFQAGLDAYKKGDCATALKEWRPLAEKGDAKAQYNLGTLYREGKGVQKNDEEALRWYKMAALQGDPDGQCSLGDIYLEGGAGVPQDIEEAVK